MQGRGVHGARQRAASPRLLWEPRVSSVLLGDWSSARVWWPHCICEEVCGWGWVLWRAAGDTGGLVKSGLASEVPRGLPAWLGLGGTSPRPGQVAVGVPRGAEVLAGELWPGALVCFRCRQGAKQRQTRAFPGSASLCFHLDNFTHGAGFH